MRKVSNIQNLLILGITLVVAGTVTACSLNTDSEIKNAASQVEIDVNQNEQDYVKQNEAINKEIERIEKEAGITHLTLDQIKTEVDYYWRINQEVFADYINKGLEYKEFSELYSFFRSGNEDVISSDRALELTQLELYNRYVKNYKPADEVDEGPSLAFKDNITVNEDVTYEYSEEFLEIVRERPYFVGATDEEITTFLDEIFGMFSGAEEESFDAETMEFVLSAFDEGNLHEENATIAEYEEGDKVLESNKPNSNQTANNNNNNQSSGSNNSQPAPQPPVEMKSNNGMSVSSNFPGSIDYVDEGKTNIDINIH